MGENVTISELLELGDVEKDNVGLIDEVTKVLGDKVVEIRVVATEG